MKLRIKGDSVRFRVPPSGVKALIATGRLDGEVRFSLSPPRSLIYSLVVDKDLHTPALDFKDNAIVARLPKDQAMQWATTNAIAIHADLQLDPSSYLALLIEKDFACLDLSDQENEDTFPNPTANQTC